MYRTLAIVLAATATLACAEPRGTDGDAAAVEAEAKALVQQFMGQLKPQLQQAIAEGGAGHVSSRCACCATAPNWRNR